MGFIDGTIRAICRPTQQQELVYSGYKKFHAVKYQSVMFPNGIIGRLDGPINGQRHDSAILHISKLLAELKDKFQKLDGGNYCLLGDTGYANQKYVKVPFKNNQCVSASHHQFNKDISALRVHVEYGFGKVLQLFAFNDFKKNQKLLLQKIKEQYIASVLLTNCHTCLYGSQISTFFNCYPPSLESYLREKV